MTQGTDVYVHIKKIYDYVLTGDFDEAVEMIDSIRMKAGV